MPWQSVCVRSAELDTNLLPFCLGAVGCAVVMVSVEAKRKENERTNVIENEQSQR